MRGITNFKLLLWLLYSSECSHTADCCQRMCAARLRIFSHCWLLPEDVWCTPLNVLALLIVARGCVVHASKCSRTADYCQRMCGARLWMFSHCWLLPEDVWCTPLNVLALLIIARGCVVHASKCSRTADHCQSMCGAALWMLSHCWSLP